MPQWSDQFPWYIKQPIDQAAHFAATFAGVWAISLLLGFLPLNARVFIAFTLVWVTACVREGDQMRRREKLKFGDTVLDLLFLFAGSALGAQTFWKVMV